jgi:16S rRNA C967 or C1407 C5-methylase (RsmB/RsmF family)/NOL1/NOP2/fmu family ribosome biogenesis protein
MQLDEKFIDEISRIMPTAQAKAMLHAITCEPAVTAVRFNASKGFESRQQLKHVPWCETSAYLSDRPQFTFHPAFHAGCYYVQDPSSMFIYHVIKSLVEHPVKYLDLCAAPGGKTTAALQALPPGSTVVANEIMPNRAQVLRENVIKWGADNCMVTCDSPKTIGALTHEFDVIATDVPCSGEGMFRKDEEAVAQWSPNLVEQCATRQRQILNDVWQALKPGGLLIYSTCTYNVHENEEIVDFIATELGASVIDVPVNHDWNIHSAINRDYPCYRFMPHLTQGEGLFMCVLRKNSDPVANSRIEKAKKATKNAAQQIPSDMKRWIDGSYTFKECNDSVIATPTYIKAQYANLHVIKDFGVELGLIKGKKIVPSHQLAMSPHLASGVFPKVEVDYSTAIAYLRGEAICVTAPRGHILIKYEDAILGWANNLGNRANNLYPKPWRIMSTHIPNTPPTLL